MRGIIRQKNGERGSASRNAFSEHRPERSLMPSAATPKSLWRETVRDGKKTETAAISTHTCPTRAARAASPPPPRPPPRSRQARRRPPASSTSPRTSSTASSTALPTRLSQLLPSRSAAHARGCARCCGRSLNACGGSTTKQPSSATGPSFSAREAKGQAIGAHCGKKLGPARGCKTHWSCLWIPRSSGRTWMAYASSA